MSEVLNPDQLRDLLGCSRDADVKSKPGYWLAQGRRITIKDHANPMSLVADCRDARDAALIAAAPELFAALAPFALLLQTHNKEGPDWKPIFGINDAIITLGDLRKAVAAMNKAMAQAAERQEE